MLDTIEIQTKLKEKLQRVTEEFLKEILEEECEEMTLAYDVSLGINLKISCCNHSRVAVNFEGKVENHEEPTRTN